MPFGIEAHCQEQEAGQRLIKKNHCSVRSVCSVDSTKRVRREAMAGDQFGPGYSFPELSTEGQSSVLLGIALWPEAIGVSLDMFLLLSRS